MNDDKNMEKEEQHMKEEEAKQEVEEGDKQKKEEAKETQNLFAINEGKEKKLATTNDNFSKNSERRTRDVMKKK